MLKKREIAITEHDLERLTELIEGPVQESLKGHAAGLALRAGRLRSFGAVRGGHRRTDPPAGGVMPVPWPPQCRIRNRGNISTRIGRTTD